jgi:hypothetical protein
VGLLVLLGCVSTRARPTDDAITLSRRPWFGVCAGVCPHYDVTVQADGRVWSVLHHFDWPDEVAASRVSQGRVERFRSILAGYRDQAGGPDSAECRHDVPPEEAELVLKTREIEIKWSTRESSAHLVACQTPENRALLEAIDEALGTVGLNVEGRPARLR